VAEKLNLESKNCSNPKYYYSMGYIQALTDKVKNISEFALPDGANIFMMAKKPF
jgi:hypothetical protein